MPPIGFMESKYRFSKPSVAGSIPAAGNACFLGKTPPNACFPDVPANPCFDVIGSLAIHRVFRISPFGPNNGPAGDTADSVPDGLRRNCSWAFTLIISGSRFAGFSRSWEDRFAYLPSIVLGSESKTRPSSCLEKIPFRAKNRETDLLP